MLLTLPFLSNVQPCPAFFTVMVWQWLLKMALLTHKIPPFHAFSQQLFFSILGGELGRLEGLWVEKALVMDPHWTPDLVIGATHRRHTCCLVHCFGLFVLVLVTAFAG